MKQRVETDFDLKIWQQERDFWIPRIQLILSSNSLLFLGYVQIINGSKLNQLGFYLSVLAFGSNILYYIYFRYYERKLNNFEHSIIHKLPWEYRKAPSSKMIRILKVHLGRAGYKAVIAIFLILWALSGYYSPKPVWVEVIISNILNIIGTVGVQFSRFAFEIHQYYRQLYL